MFGSRPWEMSCVEDKVYAHVNHSMLHLHLNTVIYQYHLIMQCLVPGLKLCLNFFPYYGGFFFLLCP